MYGEFRSSSNANSGVPNQYLNTSINLSEV